MEQLLQKAAQALRDAARYGAGDWSELVDALDRRASPASVPEGMELSAPTILPDGSGFGILSLPLPKDHWLYAEREYEKGALEPKDLPAPILTHALRQQVIDAIRYAVRSATNCGKEDDFDPDALVQNAVYALCGPYGAAAPTPPVSDDRNKLELYRELLYAVASKFPGESRHQTALRYIRNAEKGSGNTAMQEGKP